MTRKRIIAIVIALFVLGAGFVVLAGVGVGLYVWWTLRGGSIDAITGRLPADTNALFVMRGFGDLALEFRELTEGMPNQAPDPAELKAREEFQKTMGFQPDDAQGWASTGLDFGRPWGGATRGDPDPSKSEWYLFVPVTRAEDAVALLTRLMAQERVEYQPAVFGTHSGYLVEDRAAFAVDDDYLVAVASSQRDFDPTTALRVFLDRDRTESLGKRAAFKDVLAASTEDWHLFGYLSPEMMRQMWSEADKDARELFGTLGGGGAGYTSRLSNEAFDSRLVLLQVLDTPRVLVTGSDALNSKVSGEALAVTRLGLNYKELWTQAMADPNTAAELGQTARTMRDEWGVDLQADIVENLAGPITLVALNGQETPDLAAWVQVGDPARAGSMLEAVTNKLRGARMSISTDRTEGQQWYFNDMAAVGLVGDHLVIAAGEGRMAKLRQDFSGGGGSFTSGLPAKVQSDLRGGPPIYAYLDVQQSLKLSDNNPMASRFVDRDTRTAARLLSGVSFGVASEGRRLTLESAWHAPPGGFSKALREVMAEQARLEQLQSQRDEVRRNVEKLRMALVNRGSSRGYPACGDEREARSRMSSPYDWVSDACWSSLGWAPSAPARGGYWVTASSGWSSSFKVHAVVDLDGDGQAAEFVAEPYRNATLMTGQDVF